MTQLPKEYFGQVPKRQAKRPKGNVIANEHVMEPWLVVRAESDKK